MLEGATKLPCIAASSFMTTNYSNEKYANFGRNLQIAKSTVNAINNYHYGPISEKVLEIFHKMTFF
jgi:hypothetical protein